MDILITTHFNTLLGISTLTGQAIIFLIALILLFKEKNPRAKKYAGYIAEWAIEGSFLIFLLGMLASLVYSDVASLAPCILCWYQRIFLYPQVIILGMAMLKRDRSVIDYSIVLSCIGAVLALYHYSIQMGSNLPVPCSSASEVSCTETPILEFGYITIPMMALTAFLMSLVLMAAAKAKTSEAVSNS